jgi:hypothetical protein
MLHHCVSCLWILHCEKNADCHGGFDDTVAESPRQKKKKHTKIPYDSWPSNRQPSAVGAEQGTGYQTVHQQCSVRTTVTQMIPYLVVHNQPYAAF